MKKATSKASETGACPPSCWRSSRPPPSCRTTRSIPVIRMRPRSPIGPVPHEGDSTSRARCRRPCGSTRKCWRISKAKDPAT